MTTKTATSQTSKKKYFCALGCGCFDTNAELQKHIYESHGGEVYDEQHSKTVSEMTAPMAEDIDKIIVEIIDKKDHYCIAHSEGQMCCCDPRTDFGVNADPPAGYGGEAQPELTQALIAYTTNKEQEAYKKGYVDGQLGAANGYDNQGNPIKYGVV